MAEILVMENITKVYPNGFIANKGVNLRVNEGEIHALVGENGAGKTTLMKILFGIENPEEGRILLNGEEVHISNPLEAIKYGVGMVHQHFMLVPSLTVAENLVLGMEPRKFGGMLIDFKKAITVADEIAHKFNLIVDPKARVEDLPVGFKQKVEILKALYRGAKVLILDEPTAVLTPQETKELFTQLKVLKKEGYTIIFISHKLNEVKELCDRVTVLRSGRTIGVENIEDVSEKDISRMMVGRDVILKVQKEKATPSDEVVLKVRDLFLNDDYGKPLVKKISFSVRRGEILGIAGVEGNGQKELSEAITGLIPYEDGTIEICGQNIKGKSIRKIRELGTSHISEDRMTYGVAADVSIKENIISDRYYKKEYNNGPLFNEKAINEEVDALIKQYLVKCDSSEQPVRMLSGGNIQKVVVAREFSSKPNIFIANQPTRGIDVGATEFIRKKLVDISREENCGVLLVSADLNEVLELSDSLIVMSGGKIVAYFEDAASVSEEELGEYMLGIKVQTDEEIGRVAYE